jgi:hypothetical protein
MNDSVESSDSERPYAGRRAEYLPERILSINNMDLCPNGGTNAICVEYDNGSYYCSYCGTIVGDAIDRMRARQAVEDQQGES